MNARHHVAALVLAAWSLGAKAFAIELEPGTWFVLSLVQTREGLPIAPEVHPGNAAEVTNLLPTVLSLAARHAVSRVVLVADRGLLSLVRWASARRVTWAWICCSRSCGSPQPMCRSKGHRRW